MATAVTIDTPDTVAELEGAKRELRWMRPSEFELDPVINRALDEGWAAKLAGDFSPEALGLFTAWQRDDGPVVLVDAQHRKVAAAQVGYDEPVPADVWTGLSERSAAELFLRINRTRNVNAIDKFVKAVQAEHGVELAVHRLLADAELEVGHGSAQVGSPAALVAAYRRLGEERLRALVDLLLEAFPEVTPATRLDKELVAVLADIERRYSRLEQEIDRERLLGVLGELTFDGLFTKRDNGYKGSPGETKRWHLAAVIVRAYNEASRSKRLTMWPQVA